MVVCSWTNMKRSNGLAVAIGIAIALTVLSSSSSSCIGSHVDLGMSVSMLGSVSASQLLNGDFESLPDLVPIDSFIQSPVLSYWSCLSSASPSAIDRAVSNSTQLCGGLGQIYRMRGLYGYIVFRSGAPSMAPAYDYISTNSNYGDSFTAFQVTQEPAGTTAAIGQNVTLMSPGISYTVKCYTAWRYGYNQVVSSILFDTTLVASNPVQTTDAWMTLQSFNTFNATQSQHRLALQVKSIGSTYDGMVGFDNIQIFGDIQSSSFEWPLLLTPSSSQSNWIASLPAEWIKMSTGAAYSASVAGGTPSGAVGTAVQCSSALTGSRPCLYAFNSTLPLNTSAADAQQYVFMTAYRGQSMPTVLRQKLEYVATGASRQYVISLYAATRCDSLSLCASAALQVKVQQVGRPATSLTVLSMSSSNDCLPTNPRQWQRLVTQPFSPLTASFIVSIEVTFSYASASAAAANEATLLIDAVQLQPYNAALFVSGQSLTTQCMNASLPSLATDERSFEFPQLTASSIGSSYSASNSTAGLNSAFVNLSSLNSTQTHFADATVPQGWSTNSVQSISLVQSCIPYVTGNSTQVVYDRSCSYIHAAQTTNGSVSASNQSALGAVMAAADQQQYVAIRLLSTSTSPSAAQTVTLTRFESITSSMLNQSFAVALQVAQRCNSLALCEPVAFSIRARYNMSSFDMSSNANTTRIIAVPLYSDSDTSSTTVAASSTVNRPKVFGQWRRVITPSFQLQNVSLLAPIAAASVSGAIQVAIEIRVQRRTSASTTVEAALLVDDFQFVAFNPLPSAVYPPVCCNSTNVCTPNNMTSSGVSLWLRPDSIQTSGSTVTQWTDVSPTLAHAVRYGSASPTVVTSSSFNNARVVSFNSTLVQSLWSPTSISTTMSATFFMVMRPTLYSFYSGLFGLSSSNGTGDEASGFNSQFLSLGGDESLVTFAGTLARGGYVEGSIVDISPGSLFLPAIYEHQIKSDFATSGGIVAQRDVQIRQNSSSLPNALIYAGIEILTTTGTEPSTGVNTQYNAYLLFARSGLRNSHTTTGEVAEIIYVNRTLTSQERFAINQYLALKYNLPQTNVTVNQTYDEQLLPCSVPVQPRVCSFNAQTYPAVFDSLNRTNIVLSLRADRGVVMSRVGGSNSNASVSLWRDGSPLGNDAVRVSSTATPSLTLSNFISNTAPITLVTSDPAPFGSGSVSRPYIRLSPGAAFACLTPQPVLRSRSIWLVTRRAALGSAGTNTAIFSILPPAGVSSDTVATNNPNQLAISYRAQNDALMTVAMIQNLFDTVNYDFRSAMPIRAGEFNLVHLDFEQDAAVNEPIGWIVQTVNGERISSEYTLDFSLAFTQSNRGYSIGARWYNNKLSLTAAGFMDFAEILIFNTSLNSIEANRIGYDLQSRYGLYGGYAKPATATEANCTDLSPVSLDSQSTSTFFPCSDPSACGQSLSPPHGSCDNDWAYNATLCSCTANYTGSNCEVDIRPNYCNISTIQFMPQSAADTARSLGHYIDPLASIIAFHSPCQNGGTCVNRPDTVGSRPSLFYDCSCSSGWSGVNCTVSIASSYLNDDCVNGSPSGQSYSTMPCGMTQPLPNNQECNCCCVMNVCLCRQQDMN